MSRFLQALFVLSVGPLVACNSTDNGTIQIITDDEAGTFTKSPALTELRVLAEADDASTVLATAQLPTSTLDLGQLSEGSSAVSLVVEGFDSSNTQRVSGASLPVEYAALAGETVPIFVQRDGELARLPGPLSDARPAPMLALVQGEYLLIAGGSDAALSETTQLFDFGLFAALDAPPVLPLAPRSIALAGTVAWLIGDTTGTYFDFSSSTSAPLTLPSGGTFADIAGGSTVLDASGVQYIVGATRLTGDPTDKILKVDPNNTTTDYPYGDTTWLTLSAPRLGATAAWMSSFGLVVVGGSATAAGVEQVMATASTGVPLPQFPSDPATGAGAAVLDATHLLVAGGTTGFFEDPGLRALDLDCTVASTSCVASWSSLPVVLSSAQAFAWSASDGLVVGNEFGSNVTHVYRVSPTVATEVPTRAPHTNARAAWSPVGSIVLFGGANVVESFTP